MNKKRKQHTLNLKKFVKKIQNDKPINQTTTDGNNNS